MIKKLKNKKRKRPNKFVIIAIIFAVSFAISFGMKLKSFYAYQNTVVDSGLETKRMDYTGFLHELENQNVEKATISQYSSTFVFYLKNDATPYLTSNPETKDFKEKLLLSGVELNDLTYSTSQKSNNSAYLLLSYAATSLLVAAIISIIILLCVTMLKSFNLSDRETVEKAKKVSFENIIGLDEIKSELLFIVSLMKENKTHSDVRIPKGILLEGPPGNGKTMLAQAIATETDVNFIAVNASDLTNKYIGETGKSIRRFFDEAKRNAPCVLFIDEIDAIGSKRTESTEYAVDKEFNGIINTLLTKLDGITDSEGVTVIAATNMASSLDAALVRPGRFDKHFYIPNPDSAARKNLLSNYLNDETKERFNYGKLSAMTRGCSCSEIENIVNEAKLISIKENKGTIEEQDIVKAIRQFQLKGLAKNNNILTDAEKETVSVHEAGHAIVGHFFSKQRISEISICQTTSGAGGYTQTENNGVDNLSYANEVFGNITMLLGGKAAEQIMLENSSGVSLGSENDINEATRLASRYVKFTSGIDYCQFGQSGVSELLKAAKEIIDKAYKQALETVIAHKESVISVANELKRNESICRSRFLEIIEQKS